MLKGKSLIDKTRQSQLADYLNEANMSEGAGPKLKQILMRGVGVHHAGVLPRYRRMVEELFQTQAAQRLCVYRNTCSRNQSAGAQRGVAKSLKRSCWQKEGCGTIDAHQIFGRAGDRSSMIAALSMHWLTKTM